MHMYRRSLGKNNISCGFFYIWKGVMIHEEFIINDGTANGKNPLVITDTIVGIYISHLTMKKQIFLIKIGF